MAGAIDDTLRKFHASLNVSDLDRSIAFYRVLLGTEPAKVRSDYAKFDLAEPPLVLSLIPGRPGAGGNLNHVGPARADRRGARRDTAAPRGGRASTPSGKTASSAATRGRRSSGSPIPTARSGRSTSFTTTSTITAAPRRRASRQLRVDTRDVAGAAARGNIGCGTRFLPRIPHDDNTLHEVRLEGSINVAPDADNRPGLLAESLRALRPGASIYVHGLAGDRPSLRRPRCPARPPPCSTCRPPAMSSTTRSRRIRRDPDREAVSDGVLRRRRRPDARTADRRRASQVTGRGRRRTRRCISGRWGR